MLESGSTTPTAPPTWLLAPPTIFPTRRRSCARRSTASWRTWRLKRRQPRRGHRDRAAPRWLGYKRLGEGGRVADQRQGDLRLAIAGLSSIGAKIAAALEPSISI